MKIAIELEHCVGIEEALNINGEIIKMMDGKYHGIIKSIDVVV